MVCGYPAGLGMDNLVDGQRVGRWVMGWIWTSSTRPKPDPLPSLEMMVIGFCFSCDDIAMLPLHDLRNSSTMPCSDHIVPNMLCFGCCQYSPSDVSINAHEEIHIVSSYILGDFDAFHTLHDSHNCVHLMHSMNNNALDISHDALHNLSLHYAIHNNKPLMMDDIFLYHASHLFEHWILCANQHKHMCIIMDDVYIYHAHTTLYLCLV